MLELRYINLDFSMHTLNNIEGRILLRDYLEEKEYLLVLCGKELWVPKDALSSKTQ
jgi:hypothetical protein